MQEDSYILCNCPPPFAVCKSLISGSAVGPRKSSYGDVVNPVVNLLTRLFFAAPRSVGRKLPRGALKLNASLALNRFEQRGADARGVANCIKKQRRLDTPEVGIIQPFSRSEPGASAEARMLRYLRACREIRRLTQVIEPVG